MTKLKGKIITGLLSLSLLAGAGSIIAATQSFNHDNSVSAEAAEGFKYFAKQEATCETPGHFAYYQDMADGTYYYYNGKDYVKITVSIEAWLGTPKLESSTTKYNALNYDTHPYIHNSTPWYAVETNKEGCIPAIGHNITATGNGHNVCVNGDCGFSNHHIDTIPAQAATCTEDGHVAYYYCADCSTTLKDSNGADVEVKGVYYAGVTGTGSNKEIVKIQGTDSQGNNLAAKAALEQWMAGQLTISASGKTYAYVTTKNHKDNNGDGVCDSCGVSMNNSYIYHAQVNATCTTSGLRAYYEKTETVNGSTVTNYYWKDDRQKVNNQNNPNYGCLVKINLATWMNSTSSGNGKIDALGHTYTVGNNKCSRCDASHDGAYNTLAKKNESNALSEIGNPGGYYTTCVYYTCNDSSHGSLCNGFFFDASGKAIESIKINNKNYPLATHKWNKGTHSDTGHKCSTQGCGVTCGVEVAEAAVAPTCLTGGKQAHTVYTCGLVIANKNDLTTNDKEERFTLGIKEYRDGNNCWTKKTQSNGAKSTGYLIPALGHTFPAGKDYHGAGTDAKCVRCDAKHTLTLTYEAKTADECYSTGYYALYLCGCGKYVYTLQDETDPEFTVDEYTYSVFNYKKASDIEKDWKGQTSPGYIPYQHKVEDIYVGGDGTLACLGIVSGDCTVASSKPYYVCYYCNKTFVYDRAHLEKNIDEVTGITTYTWELGEEDFEWFYEEAPKLVEKNAFNSTVISTHNYAKHVAGTVCGKCNVVHGLETLHEMVEETCTIPGLHAYITCDCNGITYSSVEGEVIPCYDFDHFFFGCEGGCYEAFEEWAGTDENHGGGLICAHHVFEDGKKYCTRQGCSFVNPEYKGDGKIETAFSPIVSILNSISKIVIFILNIFRLI